MRKNESAGFREIFFFLPLLVHIDWPPRTLTFFFVFLLFLKLYFSHAHAAGYCVRVFFHFSRVIRIGGELPPVENGSIYNRLFIYIYIYVRPSVLVPAEVLFAVFGWSCYWPTRTSTRTHGIQSKSPREVFCEMDRNVVRTGRRRRKGDVEGGGLSRQ